MFQVSSKRDCSSLARKREHSAPNILEPRFSRANQALQSHVAAECLCLGGGALSDITFDHHVCGDVGYTTGACRAGWNLTEGIYQQIVLHDFLRIRLDTFFSWLLCYTATLGVSQGHSWGPSKRLI